MQSVQRFTVDPRFRSVLRGRAGVRVISDVHGQAAALAPVIEEARALNLAILSVGDLIDRGPDAVEAMRLALDLLDRGDGLVVGGNHEQKFWRKVGQGKDVKVSHGLEMTLTQIEEAGAEGAAVAAAYAAAVPSMPLWLVVGNHIFAHAAVDPLMLDFPTALTVEAGGRGRLASLALYGETTGKITEDGFPERIYTWIDRIPNGYTVIVGHDVVEKGVVVERDGALGGKVVHLDTGAWMDGGVQYRDIPLADLGLAAGWEMEAEAERVRPGLLTILIGPSGAGKSTWTAANRTPDEVLSSDMIREELFGTFVEQQGGDIVFATMRERAKARLINGLPVTLDATHLRRADRLAALRLVDSDDPALYVVINRPVAEKKKTGGWRNEAGDLIDRHEQMFRSQERDILSGDGQPNVTVLDTRVAALPAHKP